MFTDDFVIKHVTYVQFLKNANISEHLACIFACSELSYDSNLISGDI